MDLHKVSLLTQILLNPSRFRKIAIQGKYLGDAFRISLQKLAVT